MQVTCEICNQYTASSETCSDHSILCSFVQHIKKHNHTQKSYIAAGYIIPSDIIEARIAYQCMKAKEKVRSVDHVNKKNAELLDKIGESEYSRYPKCEVCGFVAKQLYKHVTTVHELSVDDYSAKYPQSHLALPEYFEYLSDTRTGDQNPMYGNGSSEGSPFAKEFYMKQGMDEKTAIETARKKQIDTKDSMDDDKFSTKPEYFMRRYGVDYASALQMLTDRQTTNSVDKIAKRNGISLAEAQDVRNEITEKWKTTIANKSDDELIEMNRKKLAHQSVSFVSLKFIDHLMKHCGLTDTDVKYGKNNELTLISKTSPLVNQFGHKCVMFDFCYKTKLIEFNGDMFHANPKTYVATDTPHKHLRISKDWTAEKIWKYDAEKTKIATDAGYEVHVVWELEWKKDKEKVLRECKTFLLG